MSPEDFEVQAIAKPEDLTSWLRMQGWKHAGSLGNVAQRWQGERAAVVIPMESSAPDFKLRWSEALSQLSRLEGTDPEGIVLAAAKAGSDIAEFRAQGSQIDDSLPLGDASTFIDSVRRTMLASANSALQPRSYYGHSLPDAARDHANSVRMGQTRRGSYIVPVISRLPVLQADDDDDSVLFEDVAFQPFARKAMLRLAIGLATLRELTHGDSAPTRSAVTESVGQGVSFELCEAVANTLESQSIGSLEVTFAWAERLRVRAAPKMVHLEKPAAPMLRHLAAVLKGEPTVGRQTFVGYVKRLDRGEDDEVGQIILRALDNDKARNITIDLTDEHYAVAGDANTGRRMVSATGVLVREPGRALRFTELQDFRLLDEIPSLFAGDRESTS